MHWVNVDKPWKRCTIHTKCGWVANKGNALYKGDGELKRDGGWLQFPDLSEARDYCKNNHPTYSLIIHC